MTETDYKINEHIIFGACHACMLTDKETINRSYVCTVEHNLIAQLLDKLYYVNLIDPNGTEL